MFLLFYLSTLLAVVQAQSSLPGSCTFESSMCGYTSDPDFTSWTLHKDGNFITADWGSVREEEEEEEEEEEGRGGGGEVDGGLWQARTEGEAKEEDVLPRPAAVLLSPVLELEDWSCLRLVYQISGGPGSLQVGQRREGESFDRPLWSSNTPSDGWSISSIDLHNSTEPYRVVVEGRPGGGAGGGSVALFQIHITPGYCLECDMEEPHLCGYSNQWNTNVNWYVGGGVARDPHSNLPDDHTQNNGTGHYMYVDSIYAKTFKEVAKLVSPMTTAPLSGCLSFQYQRGAERGNQFSVYTRDQAGQYQELWRADTDGQDPHDWTSTAWEWIPAQVDLKAPYSLQVVFEVAFNSPRGGHVALDDISFSPEFCSAETEPTFDPSIANCDFEAGFCRYTQDPLEASPWKMMSIQPNVYRTGDHSTGAGSFLLAHSHLSPRSGYVSRLLGPLLPGNMKYCLRFFYSLRGFIQTDQALAVFLQDQSSVTQERVWTQGERSRGVWIGTDITFQSARAVRVVFVSTCTSFWDCGSVALDDITVSLGDCDLPPGHLLPVPGHCDFEAGHCGYAQDRQGDTDDWGRKRGPTPTSYTGPRGDHTTGLGYYMHIEASSMLPGQNARLLSSPLRGSRGPQCLVFYYHMYGSGTGHLTVHLQKGGELALVWRRAGEQSISWLRATVEYRCDQQHQIVFEATRGSSIRSDIAIDDIVFESGPCPEAANHAPENPNNIE